MSGSDDPKSDGQAKRANCVLDEMLQDYVHSFTCSIYSQPMVEFAIYNSVQAPTAHTALYLNDLHHPQKLELLKCRSLLREKVSLEI